MNLFQQIIKYVQSTWQIIFNPAANSVSDSKEIPVNSKDYLTLQIKQLDEAINAQLNEILHHPEFLALEAVWRGLRYMLDEGCERGRESVKVRIFSVTKAELIRDFTRAIEIETSVTFQKIYGDTISTPGKAPFGLLIGAYEFINDLHDITLLEKLSYVAETSHAPFISAAAPEMMGIRSFDEILIKPEFRQNQHSSQEFYDSFHRRKLNTWRSSESSKFAGLCLPHILLRQPYNFSERDKGFIFRENSGKEDLLWGNSAYAFAACVMRAYREKGWIGSLSDDVADDGQVRNLPLYSYHDGNRRIEFCTDADISEAHKLSLTELGFLALGRNSSATNLAFLNDHSLYKDRFVRPQMTLPYMFGLSRIAHYLMVITRDRPFPFNSKEEGEKELRDWLSEYTEIDNEEQNDIFRPLRESHLDISDIPGKPGKLRAVVYLRFNYQLLEQLPYGMRFVLDLP